MLLMKSEYDFLPFLQFDCNSSCVYDNLTHLLVVLTQLVCCFLWVLLVVMVRILNRDHLSIWGCAGDQTRPHSCRTGAVHLSTQDILNCYDF